MLRSKPSNATNTNPDRVYHGDIATDTVTVNGQPLNPRLDLRNHSPTGLTWGYMGSGPAQLALAILANEYGDEWAEAHYQRFKSEIISVLPGTRSFRLTTLQISKWRATLNERQQSPS